MIKDENDPDQDRTPDPEAGTGPRKKVYAAPVLVDWGTLVELTGGPAADIADDGFSGSGGV